MVSLGKKKEGRKLGATLRRINSFLLMVSLTLSLRDVGEVGGEVGGARQAGNLPWIKNSSLEVHGEAGKPPGNCGRRRENQGKWAGLGSELG